MNKKYILLFLPFLPLLTNCNQKETLPNYLDTQKYTISEESTYTILQYDMRNSIILSMLDAKKDTPDQAAEILSIRKRAPEKYIDAKLRMALLDGNINQLDIKQKTIEEIRKQNINLYKGEFDVESLQKATAYYTEQITKTQNKLAQSSGLSLKDAFIDLYIFEPALNPDYLEEDAPLPLLNAAKQIAVSRFDNIKWHKKISACVEEKSSTNDDLAKNIIDCAEDYTTAFSKETNQVIKELRPYQKEFFELPSMPEKTKMKKVLSKDGTTYIWQPQPPKAKQQNN